MSSDDLDRRIGARIRSLRQARGLTLDGLAEAAGVSRAMLSRVERGESSPTAQLLGRVCGGLDTTLSALFAEAEGPSGPLSRRAGQKTWRDPASGYLRRNVSPAGTGSPVDLVEVEFPPGATVAFENQRLAGMEQYVWVLDGTLDMGTGDETFRLEAGDCLFMRLDLPTRFHNPTERPVRYAVILNRAGGRP
ncbi:helix-turn-helix domain-containing protein [Zavarzinia sp.]|uniref:helix-turn-helix domain-containing protein n=1 Tax=Zavarzinia sp. TaxID=2027920 RepID=UPI00356A283D